MPLVEHDDMTEALLTDTADQAFNERIGLRRQECLGRPMQTSRLESSSGAAIEMMQTTDSRNRDHLSFRWMLDSTRYRSVTFQRKMRAGLVIIDEIRGQDAPEMPLVEHDHVVEARATG